MSLLEDSLILNPNIHGPSMTHFYIFRNKVKCYSTVNTIKNMEIQDLFLICIDRLGRWGLSGGSKTLFWYLFRIVVPENLVVPNEKNVYL